MFFKSKLSENESMTAQNGIWPPIAVDIDDVDECELKRFNLIFKVRGSTYRTTTLILSSGVDGALSDDLVAMFSNDSASRLRLQFERISN